MDREEYGNFVLKESCGHRLKAAAKIIPRKCARERGETPSGCVNAKAINQSGTADFYPPLEVFRRRVLCIIEGVA